jgi:hypothetical protein
LPSDQRLAAEELAVPAAVELVAPAAEELVAPAAVEQVVLAAVEPVVPAAEGSFHHLPLRHHRPHRRLHRRLHRSFVFLICLSVWSSLPDHLLFSYLTSYQAQVAHQQCQKQG